MRTRPVLFALMLAVSAAAYASPTSDRARDATEVLVEILEIPEHTVPPRLLRDAEAIAVIPDVIKAGFVVGGKHGKGLLSVRGANGAWSNPSFIQLTGGSFGFQAGVQSADVILVFRSRRGVESLVNGKFTLGADASVAAGPVGRNAAAGTDAQLKAEILSYSRARGLFAGVALDGAVLQIDKKANREVYGRNITPRAIFEGRSPRPGDAITEFRDQIEEATARAAQK
jgi:lipid-binding SYLF domain-containing protein